VSEKCEMRWQIWLDSTKDIVHQDRLSRRFRSILIIYIIKLCGVKYNLFDGLVKGLQLTISGSLAKLAWNACILKYHNRFCIAKTFDTSNIFTHKKFQKACDSQVIYSLFSKTE
jgi:hypothetical protein